MRLFLATVVAAMFVQADARCARPGTTPYEGIIKQGDSGINGAAMTLAIEKERPEATQEEVKQIAIQRLVSADGDGDGSVSKKEYDAQLKRENKGQNGLDLTSIGLDRKRLTLVRDERTELGDFATYAGSQDRVALDAMRNKIQEDIDVRVTSIRNQKSELVKNGEKLFDRVKANNEEELDETRFKMIQQQFELGLTVTFDDVDFDCSDGVSKEEVTEHVVGRAVKESINRVQAAGQVALTKLDDNGPKITTKNVDGTIGEEGFTELLGLIKGANPGVQSGP